MPKSSHGIGRGTGASPYRDHDVGEAALGQAVGAAEGACGPTRGADGGLGRKPGGCLAEGVAESASDAAPAYVEHKALSFEVPEVP